jgi:hypothetical protein
MNRSMQTRSTKDYIVILEVADEKNEELLYIWTLTHWFVDDSLEINGEAVPKWMELA